MPTDDERILDRIKWRARRGLLENDILLSRFLKSELTLLSKDELQTLEQLLRMEDNDLLDMLMGRQTSSEANVAALIARIRSK
jgi:antitoxin CptB